MRPSVIVTSKIGFVKTWLFAIGTFPKPQIKDPYEDLMEIKEFVEKSDLLGQWASRHIVTRLVGLYSKQDNVLIIKDLFFSKPFDLIDLRPLLSSKTLKRLMDVEKEINSGDIINRSVPRKRTLMELITMGIYRLLKYKEMEPLSNDAEYLVEQGLEAFYHGRSGISLKQQMDEWITIAEKFDRLVNREERLYTCVEDTVRARLKEKILGDIRTWIDENPEHAYF